MQKIYIFGGRYSHSDVIDTCLQFDAEGHSWKQISKMNEARSSAACIAFQGKIQVSGGWTNFMDIPNMQNLMML